MYDLGSVGCGFFLLLVVVGGCEWFVFVGCGVGLVEGLG